jgi:hypothetical protein
LRRSADDRGVRSDEARGVPTTATSFAQLVSGIALVVVAVTAGLAIIFGTLLSVYDDTFVKDTHPAASSGARSADE